MGNMALGFVLGLTFMFAIQYANYFYSRLAIGKAYRLLAKEWDGVFKAGSFFKPPTVFFDHKGTRAELSSFYLYRGKTGNYTQLRFSLDKAYLQAFIVTTNEDGYSVDSVRPELANSLMEAAWSEELANIDSLSNAQGIELRFDGDTFIVRKRGLLIEEKNLTVFKNACVSLLDNLFAGLGEAIGKPRVLPECQHLPIHQG